MTQTETNPLVVFTSIATIISSCVAYYYVQLNRKNTPVLKPTHFQKFPLIQKTRVSHNTCVYRFGLPRPTDRLGLPIGQHISIGTTIDDREIVRSYTPITTDDTLGYFDLLIKTYDQGNISRHVNSKQIGETIDVRGPKGFYNYSPNMTKKLGMVAGGTGITPMYQILTYVLSDPEDKTEINLLYGNISEDDILLRAELDLLAEKHPDQFSIYYILNQASENWKGGVGFISPEMIQKYLPGPTEESQILLCGPPPMISAMKKAVVGLGYEKPKPVSKLGDQVFVF